LESIARRRRVRPPELAFTTAGWPEEMLQAAQWVWARRVFNEAGSVQIATRLRASASASGVTLPAVTAALERLEEDERLHQELARAVLARLGGAEPRLPEPPAESAPEPAVEFARLVLIGLSVCETVSAERYTAVRSHTDRPLFRDCIELFLRDEVVHSELGFLLLPVALERLQAALGPASLRPFVQRELRGCLRELDLAIGLDASRRGGLPPARAQPPDNPGVVEPAVDARAFYEAVQATILPRLELLGLEATAIWERRWQPDDAGGLPAPPAHEAWEQAAEALIAEDSRARRAAPLEFVGEVLEVLRDSDLEGFSTFWRSRVTAYRWYADDALECLDRVLAAPPPDLRERLQALTGFALNHAGPTQVTPYSHEDVVAWLRDLAARMRAVYDEVLRAERPGEPTS
jgi:hypothetical protein